MRSHRQESSSTLFAVLEVIDVVELGGQRRRARVALRTDERHGGAGDLCDRIVTKDHQQWIYDSKSYIDEGQRLC